MLSGWYWVVLWNANSTSQDRVLLLAECSLSVYSCSFYVAYLQICWYRSLEQSPWKAGNSSTRPGTHRILYKPAIPLYSQDAVSGPDIWPRDSSPHPPRLLQIGFNIISSISSYSSWCRSTWFPHQIVYAFVVSDTCNMLPHLVLEYITLIVFGEDYKPWSPSCIFLHLPALFPLPSPNNFRRILLSNTFSLCCFLIVRDQVLHPHTLNPYLTILLWSVIWLW
jgi:hypothetical protein